MKKTKIFSYIFLGALSVLAIRECSYHIGPSERYRQEFQEEVKTYSEKIKNRRFPRNSKTENTINLTVYLDAEFKLNHDRWLTIDTDWEKDFETSLEKAAKRFNEEFNINFQVDEVKYWNPEIESDKPLHKCIDHLFEKESDTIGVIGLTGKETYNTATIGVAQTKYLPKLKLATVIRDIRKSPIDLEYFIFHDLPLENLIQHEISHWFYAHDLLGIEKSVMDYNYIGKTNRWDHNNKLRMESRIPEILEATKAYKNLKTKP
ncbi:MAG: hypothetical protein V1914_03840 [archaeon]